MNPFRVSCFWHLCVSGLALLGSRLACAQIELSEKPLDTVEFRVDMSKPLSWQEACKLIGTQDRLLAQDAADLLGRRSPLEIADARSTTEDWMIDDPAHAGAALIHAYALRNSGRFDECNRVLEKFGLNFELMKTLWETVNAQIEFVGGNLNRAQERLAPLTKMSPDQAAGEPYLIRGWLFLADGKFDEAQKQAARLRVIDGKSIEAVVIEGLAMAMASPRKAKDGLKILRAGQLYSSPADWHYHEALAIVHSLAGDESFARREIALALQSAPSHIRPDLEEERKIIETGRLPPINWNERLLKLWKSDK